MSDFFRFPHTPHLAWLGVGQPREDKVLSREEAAWLLSWAVTVEEKADGANVGISRDADGALRVQNRGGYLSRATAHAQFAPLWRWLDARPWLADALAEGWILFGEWCYARHSVAYDKLPDYFIGFDIYDRGTGVFLPVEVRDAFLTDANIRGPARVGSGRFTLAQLRALAEERSAYGPDPREGLIIRAADGARAKLVRPGFIQAIEGHWRRQPLRAQGVTR